MGLQVSSRMDIQIPKESALWPLRKTTSTVLTWLFGLGAWKNLPHFRGPDCNFPDGIMETVVAEPYNT